LKSNISKTVRFRDDHLAQIYRPNAEDAKINKLSWCWQPARRA